MENAPRALVATVRPRTSTASRIITLVAVAVPPLGVLSAAGVLWGVAIGPVDVAAFVLMYVIGAAGITVGYHRLFSHRAFKSGPGVRAALAIAGSLAMQGPVTQWVTDHRKHHALSDRDGDPHSPHHFGRGVWGRVRGFWHAQMGWLFTTKGMERGERWGRDLYADPLVRRIDRLYMLWVAVTFGVPFLIGWLASGLDAGAGFQTFVWAGLIRVFLFDHITWSVNSVCHMFGRRSFATTDESRNVWALAVPTFGEAWHNNHHAFPGSARHGLDRGQVDLAWLVIRGLERLGLVWDVKLPTTGRMEHRRSHAEA